MSRERMDAFFARTMASDLLADALALYRNNPGLVDTQEAVSRRLGVSARRFAPEVEAMKRVGVLKEEQAGKFRLLFYDRAADALLGEFVGQKVSKKAGRAPKR
jgi:hypothetical protein